jgi:hypothetical protein
VRRVLQSCAAPNARNRCCARDSSRGLSYAAATVYITRSNSKDRRHLPKLRPMRLRQGTARSRSRSSRTQCRGPTDPGHQRGDDSRLGSGCGADGTARLRYSRPRPQRSSEDRRMAARRIETRSRPDRKIPPMTDVSQPHLDSVGGIVQGDRNASIAVFKPHVRFFAEPVSTGERVCYVSNSSPSKRRAR